MQNTKSNSQTLPKIKLNKKQLEAAKAWADTETEVILYGGAKGGGKSFVGCLLIFNDAFTYADTAYFISRETISDLRNFTIPSANEVIQMIAAQTGNAIADFGQWHLGSGGNVYRAYNGSRIYLLEYKDLPTQDPTFQRYGSRQFTRGWIEEGGQASSMAFENMKLTVGRWRNMEYSLCSKLLITANPSNNFIKSEFYTPFINGTLPKKYKFIQAFASDNIEFIGAAYVKTLSEISDEVLRKRLFEGSYEFTDDENQLINNEAAARSIIGDVPTQTVKNRFITADIALFGSDLFICIAWEGYKVLEYKTLEKSSISDIEKVISDFKRRYSVPENSILFDADGVGGALTEYKWIRKEQGFHGGSTAIKTDNHITYSNLRTQCTYLAADAVNNYRVDLGVFSKNLEHKERLTRELSTVKRGRADSEGKLFILPKRDVKLILGFSPDFWDAIMMRFAFDVRPKPQNMIGNFKKI